MLSTSFSPLNNIKINTSIRLYASLIFFLVLIPLCSELFSLSAPNENQTIILQTKVFFSFLFLFCLLVLIINPQFWELFTAIHLLMGIAAISGGNFFLGCLLLVLGSGMIYKSNYFNEEQPHINTPQTPQDETVINLKNYDLTLRELYALSATLRGESYYAISLHLSVSESVVKKMMLHLYSKMGYKNRELFIHSVAGKKIIFPDWYEEHD